MKFKKNIIQIGNSITLTEINKLMKKQFEMISKI